MQKRKRRSRFASNPKYEAVCPHCGTTKCGPISWAGTVWECYNEKCSWTFTEGEIVWQPASRPRLTKKGKKYLAKVRGLKRVRLRDRT